MSLQEQYNTVVENAKNMIKQIVTSSGEHNNTINAIIEQIAAQITKLKGCMQQINSIKEENKQLLQKIEDLKRQQQDELKNLKQQDKDANDKALKENIERSIQNVNEIITELSTLAQSLKSNNAGQINKLQENVKTITEEIGNLCASASKEVKNSVENNEGKTKIKVSDGEVYVTPQELAALKKYLPAYANLPKNVVLENLPKLMRMKRTSNAERSKRGIGNRPAWRGGFRYGDDLDRILRNSPMRTLNNSTPSKQITLKSKSKTKTKSISIRTRKNKKVNKVKKVKSKQGKNKSRKQKVKKVKSKQGKNKSKKRKSKKRKSKK